MTVTCVLDMTLTQTWQMVVDTSLRKDKDNFKEYLLREGLPLQTNVQADFIIFNL